jgi:Zn-dependent protease
VSQRWQRIVVSLAGPGIQLALYGVIRLTFWLLSPETIVHIPNWTLDFIDMLLLVNLTWPLFNLLPVWPLDGGMVARDVATGVSPHGGLRFSLGLSIGVAAFIAIHALIAHARPDQALPYLPTGTWVAILFGILALQSWQLLQQARVFQPRVDDRLPWESDPDAWKR